LSQIDPYVDDTTMIPTNGPCRKQSFDLPLLAAEKIVEQEWKEMERLV